MANPFRRHMPQAPFVLILQHDRHEDADTVLVAPLSNRGKATRRDVGLDVLGKSYVLRPLQMAAVRRAALLGAPIDNLAHESFRIQTALDIVFSAAG